MRRFRLALAVVVAAIAVAPLDIVEGQGWPPPPVDLGIQNLAQQTGTWCWAAVAQQIIMHRRGPPSTPQQCALVARALNAPPQVCCQAPQQCMAGGSLQWIQGLIHEFGGRPSSIAPPTDPMTLYGALRSGYPIIVAVRSTPFSGHVIVIRGMYWAPTPGGPLPVLLVNDPMGFFTQPVPLGQIAQYWEAAIVVY